MCPHRKLTWFADHGRTTDEIEELRQLVINRFDESYPTSPTSTSAPNAPVARSRHSQKVSNPVFYAVHISQYFISAHLDGLFHL